MDQCLILTYVKMLSYAEDLIPKICWQHLDNSEIHKYSISMHTNSSERLALGYVNFQSMSLTVLINGQPKINSNHELFAQNKTENTD